MLLVYSPSVASVTRRHFVNQQVCVCVNVFVKDSRLLTDSVRSNSYQMADEETYDEDETAGEEQDDETEQLGEEEQDEEHAEEEEEEKVPPNPLTEEIMAESLSLLCKTGDGLAHAYVKLDIHERGITEINMLNTFVHLRYVDVSKNALKDISVLSALTHMLTLKADENLLTCVQLEEMPFLQTASFSHNKINTTEGINHPMLEHLILNNNNISHVSGLDATKLTRLHTLELRGNKLESTDGIYLPNLKNLFLATNVIKRIEGLTRCAGLTTVHLRDNQLESLDGFTEDLKELQYINLRGNLISSVKEAVKLKDLPFLRALALSENPVAEEDDYRLEVLIALRTLERLDKDEFTDEERTEAEEIFETRKAEAEAAEAEAKELEAEAARLLEKEQEEREREEREQEQEAKENTSGTTVEPDSEKQADVPLSETDNRPEDAIEA